MDWPIFIIATVVTCHSIAAAWFLAWLAAVARQYRFLLIALTATHAAMAAVAGVIAVHTALFSTFITR